MDFIFICLFVYSLPQWNLSFKEALPLSSSLYLQKYQEESLELFTVAKTWKQTKCPSMDVWVKKRWYMYTMEYYWAIKNNEIMSFAATWMGLEVIIPSEVS